MRDFRDAKTMAHALRDALKNRAFGSTHSECLELVAKMFGYDNWNISSAKIEATVPASDERLLSVAAQQNPAPPKTLYCSFCGKSQHEVRKLIAGPEVYICDECVELCTDFVNDLPDKDLSRLMEGGAENARIMSTEELARYVERGRMGVERNQLTLRSVQRKRPAKTRRDEWRSTCQGRYFDVAPLRIFEEQDAGRTYDATANGTTPTQSL